MSTDNLEDAQVSLLEPPANATLEELVIKRIDNLRPKLLDLSRRNPLISTKLSARSISFVRVVDEVPDVLYNKLCNEQGMDFSPLPDLDDDPKDEHSRDFKNAYSEARLTDAVWMAELDALEQSDEEYAEKTQKLERKLKDRIRESLQMAPRQLTKDTSLAQHAKNNNISPSFDLPSANQSHEDGRHGDKLIQTLLLPDDLERKLNGLISKCNSWIQETGIHVLYAAFGFLEWTESKTSESSYSPLIMIPVDIEKNKTRKGFVFTVNGRENAGETNSVLTEKLRQEFGIDLPQFNGEDLETYFESIAALAPKTGVWKVRRQVVFGVFPSARIAMFRDLDPESEGFEINGVVTKLLGGNASGVESVFGDEYDVDSPELESKVPYLVLDADSSQFSTMIDVARGNDLAVEGPPGTGKSQTIVNIIAAALAEGKKVLFVAEKSAALDVVKSRLEAIGLGEFILPLQAERSTREQVIQSIRDRLEMAAGFNEEERLAKIHNYKEVRKELQQYIDLISSKVGDTGLTGFEVLGKDIAVHTHLAQFPKSLQQPDVDDIDKFDRIKMEMR